MSKQINNIKNEIMNQIHDEKIKMKPKSYFVLGTILSFVGLVFSFVTSVFFMGLIRFYFRSRSPMKMYRLDEMISGFPWWIVLVAILGLILGIMFLRKYDFSLKIDFKILVLVFVLAAILSGFVIDKMGLNDLLLRRSRPMQEIMRQHMKNDFINLQNQTLLVANLHLFSSQHHSHQKHKYC